MTLKFALFDVACVGRVNGWVQTRRLLRSVSRLHIGVPKTFLQNIVQCLRENLADDALAPHCCDFGLQAFGKKHFLSMIASREGNFVPSWGPGAPGPCTKRGRQQKWYKDFWLLRSQRFSRLWLYRAARTVLRYPLLRIWSCYRRSHLIGLFTENLCCGRGQALVRHTPFMKGCV